MTQNQATADGGTDSETKQQGLNATADSGSESDPTTAESDDTGSKPTDTDPDASNDQNSAVDTAATESQNGAGAEPQSEFSEEAELLDSIEADESQSRKPARRVFATELRDAKFTFRENDDDRSPVYALLPTGEKANRVFIVGTLTEVEDVGQSDEYLKARIAGPTGTFFAYAGQYNSGAAAFLREAEPPAYVAVVAKPSTFETDTGDVNVSLRPESITEVDQGVRDQWVSDTADQTFERIEDFDPESTYGRLAQEKYGQDAHTKYIEDGVVTAMHDLQESDTDSEN